ncbi:hypothetical protein Bbelb_090860 [Branchiostoma belcheri]|nr:hypothetical protein Bbelb_090860 [Branchiostoma belcheri]
MVLDKAWFWIHMDYPELCLSMVMDETQFWISVNNPDTCLSMVLDKAMVLDMCELSRTMPKEKTRFWMQLGISLSVLYGWHGREVTGSYSDTYRCHQGSNGVMFRINHRLLMMDGVREARKEEVDSKVDCGSSTGQLQVERFHLKYRYDSVIFNVLAQGEEEARSKSCII